MDMSRRTFGALVLGSATAGLAGCSNPSTGSTSTGSGIKDVTFWGGWSGDQAAQIAKQVTAFNAAQTDYTVKYVQQKEVEQKLLTGLASGQVPDVVLWDRFQTSLYVPKGALTAVDDLIASDKIDTSQLYDQALSEMTVNGKPYGLPLIVDNRSLFYNVELLEKAGVEPPTTWDSLLDVAQKTTQRKNGKLAVSGFALDDPGLFSIWLRQAGGTMLSADSQSVAFNSPEGLKVLEFWKQLLTAGVYEPGFGAGGVPFAEGKMALQYNGPWALADLKKVPDLKYGIVEPPAGPNGDKAAAMGGFGLVIPRGAKNSKGAWAFMKWWCATPANALSFGKISGQIPANKTAAKDAFFTDDASYKAFVATMEYAAVRPSTPGYSDVEGKALIPALQKFLANELPAEQALANAEKQGNQILADNRR